MTVEYGVTENGLVLPRSSDWLEKIRDDFEAEVGVEIDWSRQSVLGPMSVVDSRIFGSLSEMVQALYDSRSLNNSSGAQLDDVAQLSLTERDDPVASEAAVTLTSEASTTSDVFVNAGTLFQGGGSDGRARWALAEDVTVPSAGGSISAIVQAVDEGAIAAPIGAIDRILTPVEGLATVTNPAEAVLGKATESDSSLRRRIPEAPFRAGRGTPQSIRERVRDLLFIISAAVVENDTASSVNVDGIVLPPHSMGPIVWPDTLTADEIDTLVTTLFQAKGGGIQLYGTESETVSYGETEFTIGFSYATAVPVTCAVTVSLYPGYEVADVEDAITTEMEEYYADRLPGDDLELLEASCRIRDNIPGVKGVAILFGGAGTDFTITATQIATLSGTVTVT